MRREVFLIGLNLYSIFLALKIKKDFPKYKIHILEASNYFLKAFNSVQINNYKTNPGFHGFENPRSVKVLNFLKKILKFRKVNLSRGLLIGSDVIAYNDNYTSWPKDVKKLFNLSSKKKYFTYDSIKLNKKNKNFLQYLKANIYGKDFHSKKCIGNLYPWFFPPNYKFLSQDEGLIFQSLVREKKLKHSYTIPENGLFESISFCFKKLLKKKGIKCSFNNNIIFSKKKTNIFFNDDKLNQKDILKLICVPVIPLLISIKNNKKIIDKVKKFKTKKLYTGLIETRNLEHTPLDNYMELIVSSDYAKGLTRISNYSKLRKTKKKIFQIEFVEHDYYQNIDEQLKCIVNLFTKIIHSDKKNRQNTKLIGYKFIRNIFFPDPRTINDMSNLSKKFFNSKNKNVLFPRQITWPINVNKHFIYSEIDYNRKIKKFLSTKNKLL